MNSTPEATPPGPGRVPPEVSMTGSTGLWQWLDTLQIGLAFTTYQTNRLFLLGRKPEGRLAVNERLFDKPMGLTLYRDSLYLACRYQLWQLENRLAPGETHHGCDRLFVPSTAHTTGDLNVHDVVRLNDGRLLFVNTDFSCLATLRPGYSFEPVWQPRFITKLVAEDRCHLNGLALRQGQPAFVTACSTTDSAAGWRDQRVAGGVVLHVPSGEIVATGLSMPHSPRWYRGRLWLLNSGTGEFGYLDGDRFVPVVFCPGFVRGLAFQDDYAIVGLSRLRSKAFAGLGLETRLAASGAESECGLRVIDLTTGTVVHSLRIDGVVEELFDVVVLPGARQPRALGFQDDDIDRLVNFPGSGGLVVTRPTVQRPGIGCAPPVAGLPREAQAARAAALDVRYQRVFHLNPDNLRAYDAMTYPPLSARWAVQPQRGELFGLSASVAGEMVGFAIAEVLAGPHDGATAELLSWYVLPAYRQRGIGRALLTQLQQALGPDRPLRRPGDGPLPPDDPG